MLFHLKLKRFCHIVVKSYYSLGVMGHESYPEEYDDQNQGDNFGLKDENNVPETLKVEDYSRIIKELQSHRKEIEKLQLDMNGSSLKGNSSSAPVTGSSKARFSNDEFFLFCPLDGLHHQLDEIIDDDVSGKEDYLTAEDSYIADQGFGLKCVWQYYSFFADKRFLLARIQLFFSALCEIIFSFYLIVLEKASVSYLPRHV